MIRKILAARDWLLLKFISALRKCWDSPGIRICWLQADVFDGGGG